MATLYIVATPIGNLEDITLRAVRILSQVDIIAAESVERARILLGHLNVTGKQLISCREANRRQAARQISDYLHSGRDVALISDAGTPGLNDPAAAMVNRALEDGFTVSPIPGPSALCSAWSVAGIDSAPFIMLGFLPVKDGARRELIKDCIASGWPFVFFEGPHRLSASALLLQEMLPQRKLVLCREMTKLHEQILHTTCAELPGLIEKDAFLSRGELVLVVEGGEKPVAMAELEQLVYVSQGLAPAKLAAYLARQSGAGKEEYYKNILKLQKQKPA